MSRSRHISARLPVIIAALLLATTAIAYALDGRPVPRPPYVFVGVAATLATLLWTTLRDDHSTYDRVAVGAVALLCGAFLRASPFVETITSGIDHGRWVMRVQSFLAAGGVTGSDMYAAAPIYILELAVGQLLLGLGPFGTRFVTIAIASLFPLVIALFGLRTTGSPRVALAALLVAVPQFLLLRTSTLLEAESLAVGWFVLALYLLAKYVETADVRFFGLLLAFTVSAVLLHFLYAVVIFGAVLGTGVLLYVVRRFDPDMPTLSRDQARKLAVGNVVAGLLIPIWILSSQYRGAALDTLRSFVDDPDTGATTESERTTTSDVTTPATSDGSNGSALPATPGQESSAPAPNGGSGGIVRSFVDFLTTFVPSSGTVGRSVGASGASSLVVLLGAVLPLGAFAGMAGIGGLATLRRRRASELLLLCATATVVGAAGVFVVANLEFNLGYRLYYFVAILLTVFAAIGLVRLGSHADRGRTALRVGAILLFLTYAAVGPMSPLGNNVDPRFGGTDWRLSESEYEQIEAFGATLGGAERIDHRIPQVPGHLRLSSSDGELYLAREGDCRRDAKVMSGGDVRVCRPAG